MQSLKRNLPVIAAALVALLVIYGLFRRTGRGGLDRGPVVTSGEIQMVHPHVSVGTREVVGVARFSTDETLEAGPAGRARVHLDEGTQVIIDRATRLLATPRGLRLEAGRIFVSGGSSARTARSRSRVRSCSTPSRR